MRRNEIFREIIGLALAAFAVFGFLSLMTFDTGDVQELQCPVNNPLHNMGGKIGSFLAFKLFYVFGRLAGWSMVLLTGLWGLVILFRRELPDLPYKIIGGILFLTALAVVESFAGVADSSGLPAGGIMGAFLTRGILLANIGRMGTMLLVAYIAVISFLLATDFLFFDALTESVGFMKGVNLRRLAGAIPFVPRTREGAGFDPAVDRMLLEAGMESDLHGIDESAKARRDRKLRHDRFVDLMNLSSKSFDCGPCASPVQSFNPCTDVVVEEDPGEEAAQEEPQSDTAVPGAVEAFADPKALQEEEVAKEAESGKEKETRKRKKAGAEEAPAGKPADADEAPADEKEPKDSGCEFVPPSLELLKPADGLREQDMGVNRNRARKLEEALRNFNIEARVIDIIQGPTITQFELELRPGTKMNSVVNLSNELAMAMRAESVRVINLPGKGTIGVEIPNVEKGVVRIRELLETEEFKEKSWKLPFMLGKDASGKAIIADLASMPHLLIAGSTGSGKSICINSLIASILMTRSPSNVKMILIDPKRVEMAAFADIPHLMTPVVTNMKKAAVALENLTNVMDERYAIFEKVGVRQIAGFNRLKRDEISSKLEEAGLDPASVDFPMPYIVVVVDELSDLMLVSSKEVENSIIRLAQKSRAVGIHLVLSTQRPSADVITGLIKSNMPSRIAFRVTSGVESRVILDTMGAEKLLGKGDMLYQAPGSPNLVRCQGTLIDDDEISLVTDSLRKNAKPAYSRNIIQTDDSSVEALAEDDEFLVPAGDFILETGRASTTLVQRRFNIGYTRASRLIDHLEKIGLVGKFQGSKAREIAWTFEEWEACKAKMKGAAEPAKPGRK